MQSLSVQPQCGNRRAVANGAMTGGTGTMRQALWMVLAGTALALGAGCASGPLLDNPVFVSTGPVQDVAENPVYVPLGPASYGKVFDKVLSVLYDAGFEIFESNRYDGRIETFPRIAPGLGLWAKPGSPVIYERLLATLQTYRHRASVLIQPAENGGFFIYVTVRKELEDLPRPTTAVAGAAIFRTENTLQRQYEVIDAAVFEAPLWIPKGRDCDLEQVILQRIKKCL
jgi:hypothetical protein